MNCLNRIKRKNLFTVITAIFLVFSLFFATSNANASIIFFFTKWQYKTVDFVKTNLTQTKPNSILSKGQSTTLNYPIQGEVYIPDSLIQKPKSIVFVVDESGSMAWGNVDYQVAIPSRMDVLKGAIRNMISEFSTKPYTTNMAIVPFSYEANKFGTNGFGTFYDIKSQSYILNNTINSLSPYGSTNGGDGLRRAYYLLSTRSSAEEKHLIFLTDGEANQITFNDYTPSNIAYDIANYPYYQNYVKYSDGPAQILNQGYYYYYDCLGNLCYFHDLVQDDIRGMFYATEFGKKISANTNTTTYVVGITKGSYPTKLQQLGNSLNSVTSSIGTKYFLAERIDGDEGIADIINQVSKLIDSIQINDMVIRQPLPPNVDVDIYSLPAGVRYDAATRTVYTDPFSVKFIRDSAIVAGTTDVHKYTMDPSSTPYPNGLSFKIISNTYLPFTIGSGTVTYTDIFGNPHTYLVNGIDFNNLPVANNFRLLNSSDNSLIPENSRIYITYNGSGSKSVTVDPITARDLTKSQMLDAFKEFYSYYKYNPSKVPATINFTTESNTNEVSLSTGKPSSVVITDKSTLSVFDYVLSATNMLADFFSEGLIHVSMAGDPAILNSPATEQKDYRVMVIKKLNNYKIIPDNDRIFIDQKLTLNIEADGHIITEDVLNKLGSSASWGIVSGSQYASLGNVSTKGSSAVLTGLKPGDVKIRVTLTGRIANPDDPNATKIIEKTFKVRNTISGFEIIETKTSTTIPYDGTIYVPYDPASGKTSNNVTLNLLSNPAGTQQELLDTLKEFYTLYPAGNHAKINFKVTPNNPSEMTLSTGKPEQQTITNSSTLNDLKYNINVTNFSAPIMSEGTLKVSITGDRAIINASASIERTYKILVIKKNDLTLSPINSLGVGDSKTIKVLAGGTEISDSIVSKIATNFTWSVVSGSEYILIEPKTANSSQAIITAKQKGQAVIRVNISGRIVDPSTTTGVANLEQTIDVYIDIQ